MGIEPIPSGFHPDVTPVHQVPILPHLMSVVKTGRRANCPDRSTNSLMRINLQAGTM